MQICLRDLLEEIKRAEWNGETDSEDRSGEYQNGEVRAAYLRGRQKRKEAHK